SLCEDNGACLSFAAMILGTTALTGLAAVTDTGLDLVDTAAGTLCFMGLNRAKLNIEGRMVRLNNKREVLKTKLGFGSMKFLVIEGGTTLYPPLGCTLSEGQLRDKFAETSSK
nr:hypothetical protein [Tanacetum cinerariifolium]